MKTPIEKIQIFRQEEFDKTDTTRRFPLGTQVKVVERSSESTAPYLTVYEYSQAGAALQQYGVFALYNATAGTTIAAGVSTSPGTAIGCMRYIVPQTNVASGSYFWGAVKGLTTAACGGGAVGVMSTAIAGQQLTLIGDLTTLSAQTVSKSAATAASIIREVQSIAFTSGLGTSGSGTAFASVYIYGDVVQPNQVAIWTADHTLL